MGMPVVLPTNAPERDVVIMEKTYLSPLWLFHPVCPLLQMGLGMAWALMLETIFLVPLNMLGTVGTENGPPVPKSYMPQTARSEAPQPKRAAHLQDLPVVLVFPKVKRR